MILKSESHLLVQFLSHIKFYDSQVPSVFAWIWIKCSANPLLKLQQLTRHTFQLQPACILNAILPTPMENEWCVSCLCCCAWTFRPNIMSPILAFSSVGILIYKVYVSFQMSVFYTPKFHTNPSPASKDHPIDSIDSS